MTDKIAEVSEEAPVTPAVAVGKTRLQPHWPTVSFVTLLVVLGLAIRLWGIGWSLPNAQHPLATYHPDELVDLAATQNVDLAHGQLDTQFYSYGAFYFYLASFGQTFGRGYGLIPSTPAPPSDTVLTQTELMTRRTPEMAGLFLAGRWVTALLGAATIPVLFLLGSRLYGRKAGILAALLYAIAPLAVVHAHFLTVDVPATFFVSLALLSAARLLTMQTWKEYIFAGVWCGLCAATKYNTALILAAPIAAHFLNKMPEACPIHRRMHFLVMLGVAALAFLIGCPGPIINWNAFWNGTYPGSGVRYELLQHSRQGHGWLFVNTGPGWSYHLIWSLPWGLGITLFLVSLAGAIYALRQRTKGDLVVLAFFVVYYLATGLSAVRFARYMLPLFPVFCLLAARLVCEPFPRLSLSIRRVGQGIGAVTVLLTGLYTFSLVRLMTLPDTRDLAADYLNQHAAPGASIAFGTIPWFYSPPLSPRFGELSSTGRAKAAQEVTRYQLRIPEREWDKSVLTPLPDYVVLSNLETLHPRARLHHSDAFEFTDMPPLSDYQEKTFAPASLFFPPGTPGPIIPEDLLYIMPTTTIYEKR